MTFLGKVFDQNGPKMGQKWGFSGVTKSYCMELFYFLHETAAV